MGKKLRGTKRKIAIKKIENVDSLRVTCTKRREGLFSKAAQLCHLSSGSQIAVLATPPSSESNVSFYSFGHSSVDSVVSAFLSGKRPVPENYREMSEDLGVCLSQKELGLGFWWEDERLAKSENPEELRKAVDSISTLLNSLKNLRLGKTDHDDDLKKKKKKIKEKSDVVLGNGIQKLDQTLTLQSTTTSAIPDDDDDVVLDDDLPSATCSILDDDVVVLDDDSPSANLDYDQDIDIAELIDFSTPFEADFDDWIFEKPHDQQQVPEETCLENPMLLI